MFKFYFDLTKVGIVIFVLLAGLAGYATSFAVEQTFEISHFFNLLLGLYFLSSGSLALNQFQEWKTDQKMKRTSQRPIASGKIKPMAALILAVAFLLTGSELLLRCSVLANVLGWLTVLLYNGAYTYWWKPKLVFGAVPGALPGALPVTIGYAANSTNIFSSDSIYLFLILFLWQMPHFWALAIKYMEDYRAAGVPTMPVTIGIKRTIWHMGLYNFAYLLVAILAPLFVSSSWIYLMVTIPICGIIFIEFFRFSNSSGTKNWLRFFLWTNFSLIVFLFVPVFDKWAPLVNL